MVEESYGPGIIFQRPYASTVLSISEIEIMS